MSSEHREIWLLPVLSQEFQDGPIVMHDASGLAVRFDYETASGEYAWREFAFGGVEAFKFTAHESCAEDQVGAYDRLVEVVDSPWVAALSATRADPLPAAVRHLRIYFDEVGCYEVVASTFTPPV